jgi:transcription elongation factor GreB
MLLEQSPFPMSKAFTREDDDAPEPVVPLRASAALPPGAKNYLTADGAERMRAEWARLREEHLGLPAEDRVTVERRMAELQQTLASAEIVHAEAEPADRVRFGATVTVREEDGTVTPYRIVGVDEVDADRGWVSWHSPLARALMNAHAGQRVVFPSPAGERALEIVRVEHAPPAA